MQTFYLACGITGLALSIIAVTATVMARRDRRQP